MASAARSSRKLSMYSETVLEIVPSSSINALSAGSSETASDTRRGEAESVDVRCRTAEDSAGPRNEVDEAVSLLSSTKREMFHTLLAKCLYPRTRSSDNFTSFPGDAPTTRLNRAASAPYFSIIVKGSMTLPRDFDILRPCASRTRPCRYTLRKGTVPRQKPVISIMRATQKKRMSYPVSSTSVGWYVAKSLPCRGLP